MEKDYTVEALALVGNLFKAVPPGTDSNALIFALKCMLGAVIGRTAIDIEKQRIFLKFSRRFV